MHDTFEDIFGADSFECVLMVAKMSSEMEVVSKMLAASVVG